jgi:hypothetical protein
LHTKEELAQAVKDLGSEDRIILQIGNMRAVIDGIDKDKFFEKAFTVVSRIMTGIEQGTLRSDLLASFPEKSAWINDLIDDFLSMGANNRYVRITNVSDLGAAAAFHGTSGANQASAFSSGAFTLDRAITETSDFDKRPSTTQYHQIYVNTSVLGSNAPSTGSRISTQTKALSLEIQLIHELFHIAEGEAHSREEFAKLGVTSTSQDGHDAPFDQMASRVYSFIKGKADLGITPSVESVQGGAGGDTLAGGFGGFHILDVDGGAGDDIINIALGSGTLVGGPGNDTFTVSAGSGELFLSAGDGWDVLHVPNGGAAGATVEVIDGWVYLGFRAHSNESATETDNLVYWRLGSGPEQIVIGGISYNEAGLLNISNSKPVSFIIPTLVLQAPWYHGLIYDISGFDADGDTLTYTILSVSGRGADASWWLSGSSLYTSFAHTESGHVFNTTISLRVSDGEFYHDYAIDVEWRPDPSGGGEINLLPSEPLPLHIWDTEQTVQRETEYHLSNQQFGAFAASLSTYPIEDLSNYGLV